MKDNQPSGKLMSSAGICPRCNSVTCYHLTDILQIKKPRRQESIDPLTGKIPVLYRHPGSCKKCNRIVYPYRGLAPYIIEMGA